MWREGEKSNRTRGVCRRRPPRDDILPQGPRGGKQHGRGRDGSRFGRWPGSRLHRGVASVGGCVQGGGGCEGVAVGSPLELAHQKPWDSTAIEAPASRFPTLALNSLVGCTEERQGERGLAGRMGWRGRSVGRSAGAVSMPGVGRCPAFAAVVGLARRR